MQITLVTVKVKPEHVDEFIEATRKNHEGAVKEPGCKLFEICQSPEDPCSFVFYEAYTSQEAVVAHKATAHYAAWRKVADPIMAETRRGVVYNRLFPR
jgi:(4S)-4-hydroxy-5-phosphonooxypentane-2,3-dione isomerase